MKRKFLFFLLTFLILSINVYGFQSKNGHKVLFEKAKYTMETRGNIQEAITQFEEIIKKYPNQREYAAKSQLYLGICKEKLGLEEAIKEYQKVVDSYPEQNEVVKTARQKIEQLNAVGSVLEPQGMVVKHIWAGPKADGMGAPSPDGKYLSFVDWAKGDLAIRNLDSGKNKVLTFDDKRPSFKEMALISIWSPDGSKIAYTWFNKNEFWELRIFDLEKNSKEVLFSNKEYYVYDLGSWSKDGNLISVILSAKKING